MPEVIPFYSEMVPGKMTSMYTCSRSIVAGANARKDIKLITYHPDSADYGDFYEYWDIKKGSAVPQLFELDRMQNTPLGYANASMCKLGSRKDYFVVLNQRTTASCMLQKALSKPFIGFSPTVVHYITGGDLNETHMILHPTTVPEFLFALSQHWNIFHNEAHFQRVRKAMSGMFTPAVMRTFNERSIFYNLGVDLRALEAADEVPDDLKFPGEFVMLYGGRPAAHKNLDMMVKAAQALNVAGVKTKLLLFLTTERSMSGEDKIKTLEGLDFVDIRTNRPLGEFHAACHRADVFLGASSAESYGISYVEMMYGGAVGVFLDRPWVKAVVPAKYQFVAKTLSEAVSMLRNLAKDRLLRERTAESLKRYILAEHDREDHVENVLDAVCALSESIKMKTHPTGWRDVL